MGEQISEQKIVYGLCRFPTHAIWVEDGAHRGNVLSFKCRFQVGAQGRFTLAACGLGFYEAFLNGKRVSDEYFKPVFTDYEPRDYTKNPQLAYHGNHTVHVNFFDVSDGVRQGENELEFLVGNGFYNNNDKSKEPFVSFGDKKLIFELFDGQGNSVACSSAQTLVAETEKSSTLFLGDKWDFTKSHSDYVAAKPAAPVQGKFVCSYIPNDRLDRVIAPVSVRKINGGFLYDFGINHTGGLCFTVQGKKGSSLHIEFGEVLNEDGTPNMLTGRWDHFEESENRFYYIYQTSEYHLSGGADSVYPLFCWRCYRYAYLRCDEPVEITDMRSAFIHTDLPHTGKFSCSHKGLMKIYDAAVLTLQNNLHAGTLSDCPHREKRAYTGDGQLAAEAMLYEFDSEAFLSKWLDDILCAQRDSGFVPNSAPFISGGGGYAWGNAIVEVPDLLYRMTGKTEYLSRAYAAIEKWAAYSYATIVEKQPNDYGEWLLGDWLAPEMTVFDIEYMSHLCLYRVCERMSAFAAVLQNGEGEEKFRRATAWLKARINARFFHEDTNVYCDGVQGENLFPLQWHIVAEKHRAALAEKVKQAYQNNGCHVDTGIVGTKALFDTLTENGMADIAERILTAETSPSFLDMLQGESTFSEHWSRKWPDYKLAGGDTIVKGGGDLSHCHPMFCSVLPTLYKRVAGLDLSFLGQKRVVFAPLLCSSIEYSFSEKSTVYGAIKTFWRKTGCGAEIELTVPDGVCMEVQPCFGCTEAVLQTENESKTVALPCVLKGGAYRLTVKKA